MKIKIEIDESAAEDEVIIRCRGLTKQVAAVQRAVRDVTNASEKILLYKGNTEYYVTLSKILFFETDENGISAHTRDEMYQTRYKLYELEDMLPGVFMRVSKSTILNTDQIYSIDRNLTASSVVAFLNTHKRVYVSRYYYKPLTQKLEEKRLHPETSENFYIIRALFPAASAFGGMFIPLYLRSWYLREGSASCQYRGLHRP